MGNKIQYQKISIIVFMGLMLCFAFPANAKNSGDERPGIKHVRDTLGIPISIKDFHSLVGSLYLKFSNTDSQKTVNDYLLFVKVYNTIGFDWLFEKGQKYHDFYILFPKYVDKMTQVLDAKVSKGMSYYSKKYYMQIGGWRTENNCYKICR